MAARTAGYDTDGDRADVLFLAKQLGVGQASQALAIVERFYPASRIPVKTAFFLEDLLQQRPAMDFHGLALPELGPPPPGSRGPRAMRVASLSQIAGISATERDFGFAMRDFLDGFYAAPTAAALEEEPPRLGNRFGDRGRADAYLAAVAEHLGAQFHLRVPPWAFSPDRTLKEPWFAAQEDTYRLFLLMDSPSASGPGTSSFPPMRLPAPDLAAKTRRAR